MFDRDQDQPILVRPKGERYELIDGDHRLTAATELGWTEIDAVVKAMDDFTALCCQLTNVLRVETNAEDVRRHLLRLKKVRPDMTVSDMVKATGKSKSWVRRQLTLDTLIPEALYLLETGELKLSNAYELAIVRSPARQKALLLDAVMLTGKEFAKLAAEHRKQMMINAKDRSAEARLAGLKPKIPKSRQEANALLRNPIEAAALICQNTPQSRLEAFLMGIRWCWNKEKTND